MVTDSLRLPLKSLGTRTLGPVGAGRRATRRDRRERDRHGTETTMRGDARTVTQRRATPTRPTPPAVLLRRATPAGPPRGSAGLLGFNSQVLGPEASLDFGFGSV